MRNARDSGVSASKTLVGGMAALAVGSLTLLVMLAFALVGLVLFVFRNYP